MTPRHESDAQALLRVIVEDAVTGLAPSNGVTARLLGALLQPFGRRFRHDVLEADAAAARAGLDAAAQVFLARYSGTTEIQGADLVPTSGPLLVTANHPGTVDTPLLWHALRTRADLLVIALDRPFLRAVPGLGAHLFFVSDAAAHRGALVRRAASHLRAGGALLTFPAGTIEPDPAIRPSDAVASVARWSRSPELLARLVPDLAVLPVAVGGVLSRRGLGSSWARSLADTDARERAAATVQIVRGDRSISPRVLVGAPVRGRPHQVTVDIAHAMRALLAEVA